MLEVPAHQDVHTGDGRHGDVPGIGPHGRGDHTLGNVGFCKFPRLGVELQNHDVFFRHLAEAPAHPLRSLGQLLNGQVRQNQSEVSPGEAVHQAIGVLAELLILAPPNDGGSV